MENEHIQSEEPLQSENRQSILEILDGLRERAANNELLQAFIVVEDGSGEFESRWCGTADRFAISGFVIGSALTRMGFMQAPVPE